MATYTITVAQNIDELTAKTGGDVYNINGGTLTVDQHSRFGLNNANTSATAATSMGNITLSATLGGTINFDARYVRMIPFNTGSGTLPALNSLVTQGGASGKLMCVYSSLTAAPVTTGTIPASGWIMVKGWNSVAYAAGALTLSGITATATGADTAGFLEIFGDDSSTATVNRLNQFNVYGAWYELGTTSGTAGQTLQIPNHGTLRHVGGVFIEATAGGGDYEFYTNVGTNTTTTTTVATSNNATQGKAVLVNNAGLVTIGNTGGTGLNCFVPAAGRKVVVPNIFFCTCTAAARNAEVIPNATVATRYDFTTGGGGAINIDKANFGWYPSFSQAYSLSMTNSTVVDQLLIAEVATSVTLTKVGVGNKPTTALLTSPLDIRLCFAGGTVTDCVFQRITAASANQVATIMQDLDGFTFTRCTFKFGTKRSSTLPVTIQATRVNNTTFTDTKIIDGQFDLITCTNVTITNLSYVDSVLSTSAGNTNPCTGIRLSSNCLTVLIDGFLLPLADTPPYTGLIGINSAGCRDIKVRNIGTRATALNIGHTTAASGSAGLVIFGTGAAANDVKIQRCYVTNARATTQLVVTENSSSKIQIDNCGADYADASDVGLALNLTRRGFRGTMGFAAQQAVYGTHWADCFTSPTAGRLAIQMNEPTALTASQVTLTNGAAFTSAGGLYMPTIGMTATFTTPSAILGHTQFANSALVMAGGTVGNYTYAYQINTGSGFSAWSAELTAAALGTALNGVGAINPATGFNLKLRITTSVTNATAITSVYLTTISTDAAQNNFYPLSINTVTFTGLPSGYDAVVLTAGTSTILTQVDSVASTTFSYQYEGTPTVDVGFIRPGYIPFYIRNLALGSTDSSIPVSLTADRNYEV
jgi:hypothetical protein